MQTDWKPIMHLLGGTPAMRLAGTQFAPMLPCEEPEEYRGRLDLAVLEPGFENAVDSLADKPFCVPVKLTNGEKLPSFLESIALSVDGQGTSLTQFARQRMFDAGAYGMTHILVDHPAKNPGVTNALQENTLGIRPRWHGLSAPQLFAHTFVSSTSLAKRELAEIRYLTSHIVRDGYSTKSVPKIVQWIAPQGAASGQVRSWIQDPKNTVVWQELPEEAREHTYPGIPLETIYFRKVGEMEAMPPFRHVAWLNIAHWQSSSRQSQFVDYIRIPILWLKGADAGDVNFRVGLGQVNSAGSDSDLKFVEHRGNAAGEGWNHLAQLQAAMSEGALRPYSARGSAKNSTAMGKAIDEAGFQCDAQAYVRATENGLRGAYEISARWRGQELPKDFKPEVFDGFGMSHATEKMMMEHRLDREAGLTSQETFLAARKAAGFYPETMDIQKEVTLLKEERKEAEAQALEAQKAVQGSEGLPGIDD